MEKKQEVIEINIPVPWGLIAGKIWGDQLGAPVLCVHGILDNCDSFNHLIPLLPKSFYYVCVDLPGHGQSSHFQKGLLLNYFMFLSALKRVVDHFKWTKIIYLGHSLGGVLGIYFSSIFPEHVEKMISLDAFLTLPKKSEKISILLREKFLNLLENEKKLSESQQPSYTIDEAVTRMVNSRYSSTTKEDIECLVKRSLIKTDLGLYKFITDQRLKTPISPILTREQIENILHNIQCPTVVIVSSIKEKDILLNSGEKQFYLNIANNCKNITFYEIDKHHDVHLTHPELLEPIIRRFILNEKSRL